MKKILVTVSQSLCLIKLGLILSTPAMAQEQLDIRFNETKQEIDNFGASDAWSIDPTIKKWVSENRQDDIESLADLFFSTETGLGLSAWRFNVGAGSTEQGRNDSRIGDRYRRAESFFSSPTADIDESKQSGQVRFLQEAHERGVKDFIAFSNSPPTWATKNGLAHPGNGSGVGSTNLRSDSIDDFSDYLVKILQFLRGPSVGVPVNYVSPINEPSWAWTGQTQEGNRYNIEDMKSVFRSLDSALNSAGLGEQISIDAGEVTEYTAALSDSYKQEFDGRIYTGGMNSTNNGLYRNYINEFLGDSQIRSMIDNKISMQGYFSDAWLDRMGRLRDLTFENVQRVSPDAKIWMSEMTILGGTGNVRTFTGPGFDVNDMEYALHIGKVIHRDLTRLNASAWQWWLGLTPYNYKDGLVKINRDLDASSVETSKMMWTLGNFSRFIRPGYLRVELPGVDKLNGLMASAYKAPDDSRIVVVAINAGDSSESVNLTISGSPSDATLSDYSVYTTNADNDLRLTGKLSPFSEYEIPARTTVTFVADLVTATNSKPTDLNRIFSDPVVSDPIVSGFRNFKLVKRNASGFALDGGSGALEGRSVELYTNINHNNLTWTEISHGGGFYSYQKLNTNVCMDGGDGGANRQNVTLQACSASDRNQHWEKIDAGNGYYRLQKRDTNYSLDGNHGGAIDQNVYLYRSSSNNENQQWKFDERP